MARVVFGIVLHQLFLFDVNFSASVVATADLVLELLLLRPNVIVLVGDHYSVQWLPQFVYNA